MPRVSDSKWLTMAGWDDVPHLTAKAKKEMLAETLSYLRDARSRGIPALGSGAIFPIDEELIKVAPFAIPNYWPRINGLDIGGGDHPTAVAGCAWNRDDDIFYVTHGYKKSGMEDEALPPVVAASVKPWGPWVPTAWPSDALQRDKGSMQQIAKQYQAAGLKMLPTHATHAAGGYGVEAGIKEMYERMQTGRWKVFSTVTEWFEEMRLYHRKDGIIVKEFDDLISASRYALMMKRFAIIKPADKRLITGGNMPSAEGMGML